MSAKLNSKIGAQSDLMRADTHGLEPMAGDESEVPMTQIPFKVGFVCSSNAAQSAASVAGLSFPSLDGAIFSGSKDRAVTGAIS